MILLDDEWKILLINSATERVLGWRREELEGRAWTECMPPERTRDSRQWLHRALGGTLHHRQSEAMSRDGRRLMLELDLTPLGRRRERALLMTITAVRPANGAGELAAAAEFDYEITLNASDFGGLRRVASIGRVLHEAPKSAGHCFEALHRRQTPCDDCPVLRGARDAWPRTTVRRYHDQFQIVTAEPVGTSVVRLSVRAVSDRVLTAIQQARIDAIAARGQLSERERAVLQHLILGRSLDDIAAALALSQRTVKFHVSNLLPKLGADSRIDLIRIIGF